jgi:hypothetical protein
MITPTARPVDIASVFPELRPLARSATRLHPRRGEPQVRDSSIGGPLLWPADEAWPECRLPRMVEHERPITPEELRQHESHMEAARARHEQLRARLERLLADPNTPEETRQTLAQHLATSEEDWNPATAEPPKVVRSGSNDRSTAADPMVALLQLHAADAPSIAFPDGADLLQVLWCTHSHFPDDLPASPSHYGPAPLVVWRRASDVHDVLAQIPAPPAGASEGFYLPRPCVLAPEQVVDYPDPGDLPDALRDRVEAWSDALEAERGLSYWADLSAAPGWKTGGWPSWLEEPSRPTCQCGAGMTLLLSIATSEWGGRSWRPPEDRHYPDQGIEGVHVSVPTDVMVGNHGDMHLFWCPRDYRHPLQAVTQ